MNPNPDPTATGASNPPLVTSSTGMSILPQSAPLGTPLVQTAPATNSITAPQPITPAAISSTETPQNFQVPNTTPVLDVSGISVPSLTPTPSEESAQSVNTQLQGLNQQLAGKSAFEIQQYKNLGYDVGLDSNGNITGTDPDITSLNAQLTTLQNNAQAIPLSVENEFQGRGATEGGVDSIQTAQLRDNAIQTLQVSSLISAKQGLLSMAQMQVQNAVLQQYGPIEDQINALTANLQLIQNSPEYSLEQQNRAQSQTLLLNQAAAQLDLEKTNYTNAQNEVLNYAPVANAQQLQAMQQATTPAQVDAIASSLGVQKPVAGRYKTTVANVTNEFGQEVPTIITTDTITGQQVGQGQPYEGSSPTGTVIGQSSTPPVGSQPQTQAGTNQPVTPTPQNGGGAATGQGSSPVPSTSSPSGVSTTVGSGAQHLPLAQYGLLANTDLDPSNSLDQMALTYINSYLKNGTVPSYTALGRGITPAGMGQVTSRANQLYQEATGSSLNGVNPTIVAGYQANVTSNNNLLNALGYQEGTVAKNFALALQNMKAGNLNTDIQPVNDAIDSVQELLGSPSMQQYFAQNTTLQNELGNLVAVKNASGGTTVHDKVTGEELLPANATQVQQNQEIATLMTEAMNNVSSISSQNASIYQQIDPLMQDPNNPNRTQLLNSQFVEKTLDAQGLNYNSLMAEMGPKAPTGTQPAIDAQTGAIGFATPAAIATGAYIPL